MMKTKQMLVETSLGRHYGVGVLRLPCADQKQRKSRRQKENWSKKDMAQASTCSVFGS